MRENRLGVIINVSIPRGLLDPRVAYFLEVVDEVREQLQEGDQLVLVDDGSCRTVRDALHILVEAYLQICVIYRDSPSEYASDGRPWRLASSRNLGLRVLDDCTAAIFLDADCLPEKDWLKQYRRTLDSFSVLRDLVIFGKTDHQQVDGTVQADLRVPIHVHDEVHTAFLYREPALFERGGGGNMLITKSLWSLVIRDSNCRGFNEAYDGGFGYEETDFAVRAYCLGAEVLYYSLAKVLHLYHSRGEEHWFNLYRNRQLFRATTRLFAGGR